MADAISHYTFLPWYRTGLGSVVTGSEGDRAEVKITVHTRLGDASQDSPAQLVHLIGPGDITGIDPRAIVRLDPRPYTNDFESNYLAAIEFFDEDYPWRYSPHALNPAGKGRVDPWLALIVLEEGEFVWQDQSHDLPRAIVVTDTSVLPVPEQLWAWAHSHLNQVSVDPSNPQGTAAQIAGNPAASCSRIMAARHLMPQKAYHAFLVPSFESGRCAGLVAPDRQDRTWAWTRPSTTRLPVYYEWTFRTAEQGDFKSLVERLHVWPADSNVGHRPMDVSRPLENASIPQIRNTLEPPRPVLDLEGALRVPNAMPSGWEPVSKANFQKWLADFLNLDEAWQLDATKKLSGDVPLPSGIKLPVVVPPIYGKWHANVLEVDPLKSDLRWLEQINLDPRNRVAAGFGTLVVQKNQEDFMARAWKQYGELFQANRYRARAQLLREVLTAISTKHFDPLTAERKLVVTSLAHARIREADGQQVTVRGKIQSSSLPLATVTPVMRRVLRDGSPVAKRFGSSTPHLLNAISDLASARIAVSVAWDQPPLRVSLANPSIYPPASGELPWLGSDWDLLKPKVSNYLNLTTQLATRLPPVAQNIEFLTDTIKKGDAQSVIGAAALTPVAVANVRAASGWAPPSVDRATLRPEDLATAQENRNFSFVAWNYSQAVTGITELVTIAIPASPSPPALDVGGIVSIISASLSPAVTVAERVRARIATPPVIKLPSYDPLEKIMAHPRFDDPTYQYLKRLSQEYLVPNLSLIPNNSITLLEINWPFIESFLVGLNHEMARELLWRGYPTDQRGSYFRLFWDVSEIPDAIGTDGKVVENFLDIEPIHGWRLNAELTPLGGNRPLLRPDLKNLVLVIRGDVLRRYPNTQVYAARAITNPQPRGGEFEYWSRKPDEGQTQPPILFAHFDPDIYCYGFNLEEPQAIGDVKSTTGDLGWYFALAQRIGEPRFGLDDGSSPPVPLVHPPAKAAVNLSWGDLTPTPDDLIGINLSEDKPAATTLATDINPLTNIAVRQAVWGEDGSAADMASILFREPYRVYYHAKDMLAKQS